MNALTLSSISESTTDRRFRVSWTKKIPLTSSTLFSKANHSEDWHHSIDEIAGVLHPSDAKFPYLAIRQATNTYLKKKGKITQEDAVTRLSTLVDAHEAKDIAVAATAHIITAKTLRSSLQVDLNVAHGSYWGLDMWMQCLIAANHGNPASVTDLEAFWAQKLLPFATHGARAAGRYLEGVSTLLCEHSTPNLNAVPEFSVLLHRALSDVAVQLEGLRLKCNWATASTETAWMVELRKSSAGVLPGSLLPEHILNSSFPVWQIWANWRPSVDRIARLDGLDKDVLALFPDVLALEGPDFIAGRDTSLREWLISQYTGKEGVVKFQGLLFEVPDCSRDSLRNLLERLEKALDFVCAGVTSAGPQIGLTKLFTELTIVRPITAETLGLLEATFAISYTPENDIYNTICKIYVNKDKLGGSHVFALQSLLHTFVDPHAGNLRNTLLKPWLIDGIVTCFEECRTAVKTHVNGQLPWAQLALDLHGFCVALDEAKDMIAQGIETASRIYLPELTNLKMAIEIYEAAYAQRPKRANRADAADSTVPDKSQVVRHPLESIMEEFYNYHLLEGKRIGHSSERSIEAIFRVWQSTQSPTIDTSRRSLAILVAGSTCSNYILRCRCLDEIAAGHQLSLPVAFVHGALKSLRELEENAEQSVIDFTGLLSRHKSSGQVLSQCWIDFAYRWLKQDPSSGIPTAKKLLEYSLKTMKAAEWIQFMDQIESLFADTIGIKANKKEAPPILEPTLLNWIKRVSGYMDTITPLETALGNDRDALRCILGLEGAWNKNIVRILDILRGAEGKVAEPLLQKAVGKMKPKLKNDWEVADCVFAMQNASAGTVEACTKIWDASHGILNIPDLHEEPENTPLPSQKLVTRYKVPMPVVEVMVAGWMQDENTDLDKVAIHSLACLLKIRVYNFSVPKDVLDKAAEFWGRIQDDIIKEAERLESLQMALIAADPVGTADLLDQLGISDSTWIDREIGKLPVSISSAVKKATDDRVEISFLLAAYKDLQRKAMGIPPDAGTLILRLSLGHSSSNPPSFCLHFKTEYHLPTKTHTPYVCCQVSQSPSELYCASTQTAFTWQLSRILHHQIQNGNTDIASLHNCVSTTILGRLCISCGAPHSVKNAHLRRSTPCNIRACAELWYKLPLEVRIPEIRTDSFAVDLMLMSVYAAAVKERAELLPGCPIQGFHTIKTILNSLPSMSFMKDATDLSKDLRNHHKDSEALISWACVQHRGLVATATGVCLIPKFPISVHQFVVANASPRLESDFVSRLPRRSSKTTVLFHGTSFDRLPAILAQGLRVCSGTALQSVGAVHGSGIYLAEEPHVSIGYSSTTLTWSESGLHNMRLLLACEVVGSGHKVSKGIHLITDPAAVMVRYLFLVPSDVKVPPAKDVSRSIATVMSSLRSGEI